MSTHSGVGNQIFYLEDALTAANERIRELEAETKSMEDHIHRIGIMYAKQGDILAAEREVLLAEQALSDKLEKALNDYIQHMNLADAHSALAEVAILHSKRHKV